MRFLIVDDSEAPLKQLHKVLSELGHIVVGESHNGEDAIQQFGALRPDVVIMDVIMPRMNGIEALQAIRKLNPAAQVVMTCSLRSCETAFLSERFGAKFFLIKPFQEESLRNVIRRLAMNSPVCCVAEPQDAQAEITLDVSDSKTELAPQIEALPRPQSEITGKSRAT